MDAADFDVEDGLSNDNKMILYDLTVQDEWRQEPEPQVRHNLILRSISLVSCLASVGDSHQKRWRDVKPCSRTHSCVTVPAVYVHDRRKCSHCIEEKDWDTQRSGAPV